MSLAERYSRATRSSHLEWRIESSDIDVLIAAGLVSESLVTLLIRLRANFDATGQDRMALRLLVGFASTQAAIIRHALSEAGRRNTGLQPEKVMEIGARTLDLFLDPTCPQCDGRGFTGGYGIPTIRCIHCRESGKRRAFWKTEAEEAFAGWLQSSIEGKTDRALAEMRRMLRTQG